MDGIIDPTGIIDMYHPGQGLMDIAAADFTEMFLDLSMYCSPYALENMGKQQMHRNIWEEQSVRIMGKPDLLPDCLESMLCQSKAANLRYSVAAAPYLHRGTERKDLNDLIQRLAVASIKVCSRIGCQYLIVKPLPEGCSGDCIWDANSQFYLSLATPAKEYGVMILLENQLKDMNGKLVRGICSDGVLAAEWVDWLNEEAGGRCFGFCMDVGACNLCGQNMYDFCSALGNRLKAVILRDCDGGKETSMLPFTNVYKGRQQTDWLNLIRGLRQIGFSGKVMMDLTDTAAACSPMLRPGLLQLAKSILEYFIWQIDLENLLKTYPSRVLFGAGNMCRNYMKCYGEAYPPLFTCDNNRSVWGTEFCGLTVKPPESLMELEPETAIFICNMYYREIEAQLRDMGVRNPIVYFNDEYMPSFYYDRLEYR